MKQTNTIILVIFFLILGVGAYFFFGALNEIKNDDAFEFNSPNIQVNDISAVNQLNTEEAIIDTELEELDALDFEPGQEENSIDENALEADLDADQQNENEIDAQIDELEGLTF